ncbi:methyl-accepting chemotaxis protein [Paraburkholderia phymatum]|uniref:methyl-accepting chemotaxis protein n=1 Tax=Paraburkholderia phymatum TaxID=148447 RepID=UPI00317F232F
MKKRTLSVSTRLLIAFGTLFILFSMEGAVSLDKLQEANTRLSRIVDDGNVKLALAEDLSRQVFIGMDSIKTILLITDANAISSFTARGYDAKRKFLADREALRKIALGSPEATELIDAIFETNDKRTVPDFDHFVTLARNGQRDEAAQWLVDRAAPSLQALQDTITHFTQFQTARNAEQKLRAVTTYERAKVTLVIVLTGSTFILLGVGLALSRSLLHELGAEPVTAREIASTIAQGDLSSEPAVLGAPPGSLIVAMREMHIGLRRVVESVRHYAETVALGSREIAQGNDELSARTEEQAASLQETAASMTELTEAVRQNADNAREANSLGAHASAMAKSGNEAVQDLVSTIGEISGRSTKIADITSLIEGIAFQTNILALNAAVEAARAGDHGRGFAVVANEVRGLAQRSASAAKEIKELIASSLAIIQGGVDQAGKVNEMIGDVEQAIERVSVIVSEIATASMEQSRGIEQINQAVSQMDGVTQQNAALVEQAAAAAQSLDEHAWKLKDAVATFKLTA